MDPTTFRPMSVPPDRFAPRPSPELQRLAEEGARKAERARRVEAQLAEYAGNVELRVALGGHYGSPRKRVCVGMAFAGLAVLATSVMSAVDSTGPVPSFNPVLQGIGTMLTSLGIVGAAVLQPVASKSRLRAERQWVENLPFPLQGYFEGLSETPLPSFVVLAEVSFQRAAPPADLLRALAGRAGATAHGTGPKVLFQSAAISGATGVRSGHRFIYRNHRMVPYVHQLVDDVLLPLHREYPLAEVRLERTANVVQLPSIVA
jgi:hypothetical protein